MPESPPPPNFWAVLYCLHPQLFSPSGIPVMGLIRGLLDMLAMGEGGHCPPPLSSYGLNWPLHECISNNYIFVFFYFRKQFKEMLSLLRQEMPHGLWCDLRSQIRKRSVHKRRRLNRPVLLLSHMFFVQCHLCVIYLLISHTLMTCDP